VTERDVVVDLAGVSGGYGRRDNVHGIDLQIRAGERLAIVGPNGAGKSTLLRLITGLLSPTAGEIRIGGGRLANLSREAIARRIAVVPQLASLPFSARVEEVVALGRLPHEDPFRGQGSVDRAIVAAAIDRVGLGRLIGRDARELSLGERQLVLLAVAIAQAAPIVILDEPTVHLDIRHQVEVMDLLADLNIREGRTVIAVLHDLHLAVRTLPRIVVLAEGRLVADGPPAQALDADRIRDVFGVDPAVMPDGPWSRRAASGLRTLAGVPRR
jgi:ABC-type cobalamin/Fe3+-siderophores transport system ATPase subunit